MITLRSIDRFAAAAILSVSVAIPAVSLAQPDASRRIFVIGTKIDENAFQKVQAGMPTSDVLALLGAPERKMRFASTKTTAWDYRFTDTWGYDSELSVLMNDGGFVVSKVTTRITQ
ncbi:MAG: outer membrane protein assembly factor BamE [Bacillota bacterium]